MIHATGNEKNRGNDGRDDRNAVEMTTTPTAHHHCIPKAEGKPMPEGATTHVGGRDQREVNGDDEDAMPSSVHKRRLCATEEEEDFAARPTISSRSSLSLAQSFKQKKNRLLAALVRSRGNGSSRAATREWKRVETREDDSPDSSLSSVVSSPGQQRSGGGSRRGGRSPQPREEPTRKKSCCPHLLVAILLLCVGAGAGWGFGSGMVRVEFGLGGVKRELEEKEKVEKVVGSGPPTVAFTLAPPPMIEVTMAQPPPACMNMKPDGRCALVGGNHNHNNLTRRPDDGTASSTPNAKHPSSTPLDSYTSTAPTTVEYEDTTNNSSLVTVRFPVHLVASQCVPPSSSSSSKPSVEGGGVRSGDGMVKSIAMHRDVIISQQEGSSGGGDAPEVHRRPAYVEAELQLLSKRGYAAYRRAAGATPEDINQNDVARAKDNWINTLPRASMGEDEVRCPTAARSADPVEAAMAQEATEAHALALMLYNQLKDTIQMNVIDSSPVVMDIGCVLGEVFARNHPKATVICVHSGETFDTYPTVATGTNGTAATGAVPMNLFHVFAKGESLIANTTDNAVAFARIFEMCNYISVTFALGSLRRDLVSTPNSIYATEEGLLALITRLLPPSLLLYTTAPSSRRVRESLSSPFVLDEDPADDGTWPYHGDALSRAASNQFNATRPQYDQFRGRRDHRDVVPSPNVTAVHRIIGAAHLSSSSSSSAPTTRTIIQYTQLSSGWACRKLFDEAYNTMDKCTVMRYNNSDDGSPHRGPRQGPSAAPVPPLGGQGRIRIEMRYVWMPDRAATLRVHPMDFLNAFALGGLLATGMPKGHREWVVAQMVGVGRYRDALSHNWVLSQGGKPMRVDRSDWSDESGLYYAAKSVGYQHFLAGIMCTDVGPDGRPSALWEIDRRAGGTAAYVDENGKGFALALPPIGDFSPNYTVAALPPSHCARMCRGCSNDENRCYTHGGLTCVPYCTDCSQCMAAMAAEALTKSYIATYRDNLAERRRAGQPPIPAGAFREALSRGRTTKTRTTSPLGTTFDAARCLRYLGYPFDSIGIPWEVTDLLNITKLPMVDGKPTSIIRICSSARSVENIKILEYWTGGANKKGPTDGLRPVRPASVQRALNSITADFGGDEEAYLKHTQAPLTLQEIALAKKGGDPFSAMMPSSFGWLGLLDSATTAGLAQCENQTVYAKEDLGIGAHLYNKLKDSIQRTLMVGGRTVDGNIGEAYGNEDLGRGNGDTSGDRPRNASYSHTSAPTVLDIGCVVGEVFARHHPQATVICVHIGRRYTTDPSPYYAGKNGLAYPTNIIHVFSREEDIAAPTFFTPSSPAAPLANLLDQCHYFTMAFVLTDLRVALRHPTADKSAATRNLLKRIIPVALTVYSAHDALNRTFTGAKLTEEMNRDFALNKRGHTRVSVVSTLLGLVLFSRALPLHCALTEFRQRYSERQCVASVTDSPKASSSSLSNTYSFIRHSEGLFWRSKVTTTANSVPPPQYVAVNPLSYAAQIPRVDLALLLRVGIDAYTRTLMLGRVMDAAANGPQGIITKALLSGNASTEGNWEVAQFPNGWAVGLGGRLLGPSTGSSPPIPPPRPSGGQRASVASATATKLCLGSLRGMTSALFDGPVAAAHVAALFSPLVVNSTLPRPPQLPLTSPFMMNSSKATLALMKENGDAVTTSLSTLLADGTRRTECSNKCRQCYLSANSPFAGTDCALCGQCLGAVGTAGRGLRYRFLPLEAPVDISPAPCT